MIYFVGAGSGAPDLITVRGMRLLQKADVIIYAGSLVNPQLLDYAKEGCEIHNSAKMTLEEVISVMEQAEKNNLITIFNIKDAFFERTLQTAEKIRKAVPGIVVNVYDIADTAKMTEEITSSDIFANATIVGMKPMDDQSVVKDLSAFRPGLVVCDAVYNPAETKLLREAKEAGCTCIGGKGMLLWQGVAAFRLYTGMDMPVEEVKEKFFHE